MTLAGKRDSCKGWIQLTTGVTTQDKINSNNLCKSWILDLIGWGPQDVADAASIAQPVVHHGDEAHKEGVACAFLIAVSRISVTVVQPCGVIDFQIFFSKFTKNPMKS